MKEDVLHDLPPKIIQDYYCDLGRVQQSLYDDFQASKASDEAVKTLVSENVKEDADVDMETGASAAPQAQKHIFQTLQYLRKLCNHPMLAMGADTERYNEVVRRVAAGDKDVSKDPMDISHSPKLLALQYVFGTNHVRGNSRLMIPL
jgi:TATA-binding protein-associated factor